VRWYLRYGLAERGRVAGVAGEYPDRDRAARQIVAQPVLDLQPDLLPVPEVAAGAIGQCRPSIHEDDRSNSAIRSGCGEGRDPQPETKIFLAAAQLVQRLSPEVRTRMFYTESRQLRLKATS
jgi:hypothetical protein